MKHSIRHALPLPLARAVAREALDSYRANFAEYQPRGRWISDDRAEVSFSVLSKTLTGALDVHADRIDLELQVPLMFRAFRGAALRVIEGEIRDWIARAERGEISAE